MLCHSSPWHVATVQRRNPEGWKHGVHQVKPSGWSGDRVFDFGHELRQKTIFETNLFVGRQFSLANSLWTPTHTRFNSKAEFSRERLSAEKRTHRVIINPCMVNAFVNALHWASTSLTRHDTARHVVAPGMLLCLVLAKPWHGITWWQQQHMTHVATVTKAGSGGLGDHLEHHGIT